MTGRPGELPPVVALHRRGQGPDRAPDETVVLTYDARVLRRRRLVTARGAGFLVDLPAVTGLDQGDQFELADGRLVEVVAAEETLIEARGDLSRLAWHIGNRHTPCQIEADRLLIREDHVLEGMLRGLGAQVARVTGPFTPEGGAYGMGRPMGHDHGHGPEHDHDHAHGHHHGHDHAHPHDHHHD